MNVPSTARRSRNLAFAAVAYAGAALQGAPLDADRLPVIAVKAVARIGNADDPKIGFSAILAVDVDRDGQIYVFESKDREIRVLTRDGSPVRKIGGPGRGPGEFTRVNTFGVVGDTVWTVDLVGRQLNLFRRSGALISSKQPTSLQIPLQNGAVGDIWPQALRDDGRFISSLWPPVMMLGRAANNIGPSDTVLAPRVRFAASGAIRDTIGWEPVPPPDAPVAARGVSHVQVNGVDFDVPQPPIDNYIRTSLNDGSAIVTRRRATSAQTSVFELSRFSLAGKPLYRLRFRYQPGRYAGAIIDTIAMRPVRLRDDANAAAFKAVRAAMVYPEFQSPVYAVWPANDGSLWLRREDNAGPRFRWIVVAQNGAVRGVVEIPRSARPMWARDNALIAVDTDETGIPWLVRYQLSGAR